MPLVGSNSIENSLNCTQRASPCGLGPYGLVSYFSYFHVYVPKCNYNFIYKNNSVSQSILVTWVTTCAYVMCALHMPPSRGGSLAHYHVVAISSCRFLPGNQRLRSELDNQKQSIGTVFMSRALNLGVEWFFEETCFVKFHFWALWTKTNI